MWRRNDRTNKFKIKFWFQRSWLGRTEWSRQLSFNKHGMKLRKSELRNNKHLRTTYHPQHIFSVSRNLVSRSWQQSTVMWFITLTLWTETFLFICCKLQAPNMFNLQWVCWGTGIKKINVFKYINMFWWRFGSYLLFISHWSIWSFLGWKFGWTKFVIEQPWCSWRTVAWHLNDTNFLLHTSTRKTLGEGQCTAVTSDVMRKTLHFCQLDRDWWLVSQCGCRALTMLCICTAWSSITVPEH